MSAVKRLVGGRCLLGIGETSVFFLLPRISCIGSYAALESWDSEVLQIEQQELTASVSGELLLIVMTLMQVHRLRHGISRLR
jgi:hypothetical protein